MCIFFLATEQHCHNPKDSFTVLPGIIYFGSFSVRGDFERVRFLVQLDRITWLTNKKIKCYHGYYYFWLIFILSIILLSRTCQLTPELLVYRNVDSYRSRPRTAVCLTVANILWINFALCAKLLGQTMRVWSHFIFIWESACSHSWLSDLPCDSDAH